METKIAVMNAVNNLIHDYRQYVIGRMGMPYQLKNICIISIALEAPRDTVEEISSKISEIEGTGVRTYYPGTLQKPE